MNGLSFAKETPLRKPKNLVFRIRKRYFDDIVSGRKKVEFRKLSLFWLKRLTEKDVTMENREKIAVFICGKRVHRRKITKWNVIPTPSNFSEQGKKDVPTEMCFAIHLGEEIKNEA